MLSSIMLFLLFLGSFKVRPCLYMSGGDSHILIGEDDVPAPWTAEYWVYLPRIEEAIRRQLMGVISRRRIFRKAFLVERMTNLKVIELTKA